MVPKLKFKRTYINCIINTYKTLTTKNDKEYITIKVNSINTNKLYSYTIYNINLIKLVNSKVLTNSKIRLEVHTTGYYKVINNIKLLDDYNFNKPVEIEYLPTIQD